MLSMALPRFLAAIILSLAIVSVVSAGDYRKGRSLKPYAPTGKANTPSDNVDAIMVQGLILCKKDGKLTPIQGAMARVTCLASSGEGYEQAPFSVVTPMTNDKGYFQINLSKYQSQSVKLEKCRVFLEAPPQGICTMPTNTNNGLSGAILRNFRPIGYHRALYSIGPFVYIPSSY